MKRRSPLAPLFAAIAAAFLSQTGLAAEATSEPTQAEALKQATATFSTYVAQCEGKIYAQIGDRQFIEFSGPVKELNLRYLKELEEHDRLNGITWTGRFEAKLGQSVRVITAEILGYVTAEEWQKSDGINFLYQMKNGQWEITAYAGKPTTEIDIELIHWKTMRPGVACKDVPKLQI
jgi:hypothetical protein